MKRTVLFLLLVITHHISASKATRNGSKSAGKPKPKTKPGKSDSAAGYLVKTNKGKTYLATGMKSTITEKGKEGLVISYLSKYNYDKDNVKKEY